MSTVARRTAQPAPELIRPLYFGSEDKNLFGCYHLPAGQVPSRGAVVLCPASGDEYYYSHRTLRQLAAQLARAGFHALRFDYFGTGDSAGSDESATLAQWQVDVDCAINELKQLSRCDQIAVVGMRLGATLAWQAVKERNDIGDLVLWNPILTGIDLLEQWTDMQSNYNRVLGLKPESSGLIEIMGTMLSPVLLDELKALSIPPLHRPEGRSLVLVNQKMEDVNAFVAEAGKKGSAVSLEVVDDIVVWRQSGYGAMVASASIKVILQWWGVIDG